MDSDFEVHDNEPPDEMPGIVRALSVALIAAVAVLMVVLVR